MSALTNTLPLYRTSLSSPAVVAVPPHHRRHHDNSVVLVEVVCDRQGSKQQAKTPARPRPRSASGSPSDRCRAAAPVNGPASDSEITARRARSYDFSDSGGAVLQVLIVFLFINIVSSQEELKEIGQMPRESVNFHIVIINNSLLSTFSPVVISLFLIASVINHKFFLSQTIVFCRTILSDTLEFFLYR